jgi:drug/metabolite transporter (DMT)-like permease
LTRTKADLLVLFAALIWGVAFYFQKSAMSHIGPFLFLGLRSLLAAVALIPFALREWKTSPPSSPSIRPFALLGGAVFFTAGALQQVGIVTATVTNTSFLTALYVVVTPFLLWLLRHEKPGPRIWLASCLAFIGIWALGGGAIEAFSTGDMLIAASSVAWSLYMVVTSASGKLAKPMQYTFIHFLVIAALALSCAGYFEEIDGAAITAAAVPLLYVGILSSAFTFALMANIVRHIPASRASILLSTEVLFGAAAGFIMLGERLSPMGWAGAALMFCAILMIQTAGRRIQEKPQDDDRPNNAL